MTKQEEIREGIIEKYLALAILLGARLMCGDEEANDEAEKLALEEITELHSQGVVIKVDRELTQVPKRPSRLMGATYPEDDVWRGDEYLEPCPICGQAGFVAVEPLRQECATLS